MCSVDVNSVEAEFCASGIVGENHGTIDQCYFKGASGTGDICYYYGMNWQVETSQVGGICGDNYSGGVISNCFVNSGGYVVTNYAGGGFCGYNRSGGTIKNSWCLINVQPVQYEYYAGNNRISVGLQSGTVTSGTCVVVATTNLNTNVGGFKRVSSSTLTGYSSGNKPTGWTTDIWDFGTSSQAPKLKNWSPV